MALTKYKYNDKTQLTEHFNVQEFKCKCGKNHDIYIDDKLPKLLEELRKELGSDKGNIVSGYRCPEHNKAVGSGNATSGYSHCGYAVDIDFYKDGKKINSKIVALKLEDMGHNYGIGYRCGGATTRTHIDVKPRKWYGDEKYSMTASIGTSFYTYFKIAKPSYKYQLLYAKWMRKEPKVTVSNKIVKISKGVKFISNDNKVYTDSKNNKWVYTTLNKKSGYICIEDNSGKQAKKI